jgi:hypothetical protein
VPPFTRLEAVFDACYKSPTLFRTGRNAITSQAGSG